MPSFRSRVSVVLLSLVLVAAALPAHAGAWSESSDVFRFLTRWFSVLSKDGCWPDPAGQVCKVREVEAPAPARNAADKDGCWPDPAGKPQCQVVSPQEDPGVRQQRRRAEEG